MITQSKLVALAFCILGLSTAIVSSRYYKSAAFERPFHFSILTLLISGATLSLLPRSLVAPGSSYWSPHNDDASTKLPSSRLGTILTLKLPPAPSHETTPRKTWDSDTLSKYALISLAWGIAATDILFLTERNTGAICPRGFYIERMIPLAQLVMVACDACVVAQVGSLCQDRESRSKIWRLLGILFLASAAVLAFLGVWSYFDRNNFIWSIFLTWVSVRDLILDSIGAALAILSSVYLLGFVHPTAVGLTVAASSVLVHVQRKILDGTMIEVWSQWWGLLIGVVVLLAPCLLLRLSVSDADRFQSRTRSLLYRYIHVLCGLSALAFVTSQMLLASPKQVRSTPAELIARAKVESDSWIASAKRSTSLRTAISEYRKRYGMPPPPNFDKWYSFATEAGSPVIDIFDQIHSDLVPFWGLRPSVVRQRTTYLLEHPQLSIGGIVIKDGLVEISPHIRGTHRWMMDVTKSMIEPFAQWLPDMQLAFNLDDECRISVPYGEMRALTNEGVESQSKLSAQRHLLPFSQTQSPPWSEEYLNQDETIWEKTSPLFLTRSRSAMFNEWISPSCPPDSPVNRYHWWNRNAECTSCSSPHMTDGFVSNWTLSGDLCHQPDLAYLHGFLSSPSTFLPSRTLFPVFGQGRVHNFADILYPSPWNYGDKVAYEEEGGVPWEGKSNSVYWRGTLSDGFVTHGAWQTFLRARFVHMVANARTSVSRSLDSLLGLIPTGDTAAPNLDDSHSVLAGRIAVHVAGGPPAQRIIPEASPAPANVSFVGDFTPCDHRDCRALKATFYGSAATEPPPALDFREHWRHRHLVDLDGAGFSGRFPPFLESGSLPYRAALFRTWWEERVHAWRHFVPLDVRLHELWSAVGYLGGKGQGQADAREMARAGRDWAAAALRKDDMRVYMFRLLLEWGRVVDDNRESLGFEV
ncbi:hypothetical protein DL771_010141 [Monosporascus sp. 5C6A]|nr:hypothetical protein DL771_010141 [Monosporascus sp. 5C6A]